MSVADPRKLTVSETRPTCSTVMTSPKLRLGLSSLLTNTARWSTVLKPPFVEYETLSLRRDVMVARHIVVTRCHGHVGRATHTYIKFIMHSSSATDSLILMMSQKSSNSLTWLKRVCKKLGFRCFIPHLLVALSFECTRHVVASFFLFYFCSMMQK